MIEINLALGGGGTRGAAHIGVLRVLEREGCRIRGLSGTSIGSIIASLYAAGYTPDQIEQRVASIDFTRLYGRLLSDGPGLLGVSGIQRWLEEQLGSRTFESLHIPCAVVAVDLLSKQQITFTKGSVVDAILGSIAVPGIFPPHPYGPYHLIDGGTLDPVPVRAARSFAPNLPTAAVILSAPPNSLHEAWNLPLPFPQVIASRLTRFRITQAFGIFLEAVEIGQRSLTTLRLSLDKPDILIRPDIAGISFLGEIDVADVVRRGEAAAEKALPEIRKAGSWQSRMLRQMKNRVNQ
jgi:NTE family protein